MRYRHEWNHVISYGDMLILRQRLGAVMEWDEHTVKGTYLIRSLYFDNPADKALREKLDGVNIQEKFRIWYYNSDTSLIHLEKKSKLGGLSSQRSVQISAEESQAIVDGELAWMLDSGKALVQELYSKMQTQGLRPKTIVEYSRELFVYRPGNVCVTLDYDTRAGMRCVDFLNPAVPMTPIRDASIVLEVKWDEFLPAIIRDIVQLKDRRTSAFSKYVACRMYEFQRK